MAQFPDVPESKQGEVDLLLKDFPESTKLIWATYMKIKRRADGNVLDALRALRLWLSEYKNIMGVNYGCPGVCLKQFPNIAMKYAGQFELMIKRAMIKACEIKNWKPDWNMTFSWFMNEERIRAWLVLTDDELRAQRKENKVIADTARKSLLDAYLESAIEMPEEVKSSIDKLFEKVKQ
jgi:hypothetical protein